MANKQENTPQFFSTIPQNNIATIGLPVSIGGTWHPAPPVHIENKESPFVGTNPSSITSSFSFGVVKSPSEQNANSLKNPEQQEKSFTEKFTFAVETERSHHDPFGSNPFGKPTKLQELIAIINNSHTILATPTVDGHWTITQLHAKMTFSLTQLPEKSVVVDQSTWQSAQTHRTFGKPVEWRKINDHYYVGLC